MRKIKTNLQFSFEVLCFHLIFLFLFSGFFSSAIAGTLPFTILDQSVSLDEDTKKLIPIHFETKPISLKALSPKVVTPPRYGEVIVIKNQDKIGFGYKPQSNYSGKDQFRGTVVDSKGRTTNTATFYLSIKSTNQPPTYDGDPIWISVKSGETKTFTLQGSDPDGDDITFSIQDQPRSGQAFIKDNQLSYTAPIEFLGRDLFSYVISDGRLTSKPVSVTMTVQCVTGYVAINNICIKDESSYNDSIKAYSHDPFREVIQYADFCTTYTDTETTPLSSSICPKEELHTTVTENPTKLEAKIPQGEFEPLTLTVQALQNLGDHITAKISPFELIKTSTGETPSEQVIIPESEIDLRVLKSIKNIGRMSRFDDMDRVLNNEEVRKLDTPHVFTPQYLLYDYNQNLVGGWKPKGHFGQEDGRSYFAFENDIAYSKTDKVLNSNTLTIDFEFKPLFPGSFPEDQTTSQELYHIKLIDQMDAKEWGYISATRTQHKAFKFYMSHKGKVLYECKILDSPSRLVYSENEGTDSFDKWFRITHSIDFNQLLSPIENQDPYRFYVNGLAHEDFETNSYKPVCKNHIDETTTVDPLPTNLKWDIVIANKNYTYGNSFQGFPAKIAVSKFGIDDQFYESSEMLAETINSIFNISFEDSSFTLTADQVYEENSGNFDLALLRHNIYEEPYISTDLQFPLKAGDLRTLWLTIHSPKDQQPGLYKSFLEVLNGNQELARIPVYADILPFELKESNDTMFGIFYHRTTEDGLSIENIARELKDIREHGMNTIRHTYFYDKDPNGQTVQVNNQTATTTLDILKALGFNHPMVFKSRHNYEKYKNGEETPDCSLIQDLTQAFGVPIFYTFDEAGYSNGEMDDYMKETYEILEYYKKCFPLESVEKPEIIASMTRESTKYALGQGCDGEPDPLGYGCYYKDEINVNDHISNPINPHTGNTYYDDIYGKALDYSYYGLEQFAICSTKSWHLDYNSTWQYFKNVYDDPDQKDTRLKKEYYYHQSWVRYMLHNRYFAGFFLAANDHLFDGFLTYIYAQPYEFYKTGDIHNIIKEHLDIGSSGFYVKKDFYTVYPGQNEIIYTPYWESLREGIKDYKLYRQLNELIESQGRTDLKEELNTRLTKFQDARNFERAAYLQFHMYTDASEECLSKETMLEPEDYTEMRNWMIDKISELQ